MYCPSITIESFHNHPIQEVEVVLLHDGDDESGGYNEFSYLIMLMMIMTIMPMMMMMMMMIIQLMMMASFHFSSVRPKGSHTLALILTAGNTLLIIGESPQGAAGISD